MRSLFRFLCDESWLFRIRRVRQVLNNVRSPEREGESDSLNLARFRVWKFREFEFIDTNALLWVSSEFSYYRIYKFLQNVQSFRDFFLRKKKHIERNEVTDSKTFPAACFEWDRCRNRYKYNFHFTQCTADRSWPHTHNPCTIQYKGNRIETHILKRNGFKYNLSTIPITIEQL